MLLSGLDAELALMFLEIHLLIGVLMTGLAEVLIIIHWHDTNTVLFRKLLENLTWKLFLESVDGMM